MGSVHDLILSQGIEAAIRAATTPHDRVVTDVAYKMLNQERREGIGYSYSGFALTGLPHKDVKADSWKKDGHNITLLLRSGLDRDNNPIGLPFGAYARLILLFLQSEAVKSNSREINLGTSMYTWMNKLGIATGGRNYTLLNEQALRISTCDLTFYTDRLGGELRSRGAFVDEWFHMTNKPEGEIPAGWQDTILLNQDFYQSLRDHPIPLSEMALEAIGARSVVIDLYIWLAYRLHILEGDVAISWPALRQQFGGGYKRMRRFKPDFIESLDLAKAAYKEAQVSLTEDGVILHPSPAPVAKQTR